MIFWTTPKGEKLTLKEFFKRWWLEIEKVPIVKQINEVEEDALLERQARK